MRRCEIVALRAEKLGWDELSAVLPATLEAIGLIHDEAGADGFVTVRDHGEAGRVVLVDNASLARRAALALSTRSSTSIQLFEVIGTSGSKRNRFRTTAFVATPAGELKPAEGQELDLEDAERTWGGGSLKQDAAAPCARCSPGCGGSDPGCARPSTRRSRTTAASASGCTSRRRT